MKLTTAPVHYTTSQARCIHSTASWFSQTYVGFGRVRWRLWPGDVQDVQELQKKKWLQEMKKQETEKKQAGRSLWQDNTSKNCYSCKILITDGRDTMLRWWLNTLVQIIPDYSCFPTFSIWIKCNGYQAWENSVYSIHDQKIAFL